MRTRLRDVPPIFYGAYALAALSLAWSAYAITDLMHSGPFGLSVALAGDIGWLTIMWAEQQRRGGLAIEITGWAIALGVGFLLVLHGREAGSLGQTIAGPFVVLVAKTVSWVALYVTRDPAALTEAQEAEINGVIRDGEHQARIRLARREDAQRAADDRIALIEQQARITAARDRADFQIMLDRIEMRAEIERCSPIAIAPITPEQPPTTIASTPEQHHASGRTEPAPTSPNMDREQPSIADLAREQVAITPDNEIAVRAILAIRPDAKETSVGAAVRRARSKMTGGYN